MGPGSAPLFFFVAAWCAFAGLVLERFLHAIVYFLTSSFVAMGGESGSVKRLASMELMKETVAGVLESVYSVVQGASTLMVTLLSSWVFLGSVVLLVFVLATMHHESAQLITTYVRTYNSDVSFSVRSSFLLSVQYGERFLQPVIVLWNAVFYLLKLVRTDVILPMLTGSSDLVQKLVGSAALLTRSVSFSVVTFVKRLSSDDCGLERLLSAQEMADDITPCFVPGRRALDLITPMGDVRMMAMYALLILKRSCQALAPPLDIMAYPFLDVNLGKALHSMVNAVLYWTVNMPVMTIKRCSAVGRGDPPPYVEGHWMRYVMCTPDMTPGFNYLIAGVRRLGQLVDNWVNVVWLVLLGALGLPAPQCAQVPLTMTAELEATMFGGNETRLVGLTSGAYALTDGNSVQYTFFLGQISHVFSPYAWKSQIATRYGIAAVTYDVGDDSIEPNSGQQTMSMMGCRCLDVGDDRGYDFGDDASGGNSRMVLECSVLRYDPSGVGLDGEALNISAPYYVPVAFAVPESAYYMRCATTKIVVDSARFPLSRHGQYKEGRGGSMDDSADGEFTRADGVDGPDEVDAVVWVIPACRADGLSPECEQALQSSGCFPYCLAARKRGGRNHGLTLYSARDWAQNVQLLEYDCAGTVVAETPEQIVQYTPSRDAPTKYRYKGVAYNNLDIADGQFVFLESWDPDAQACTYNPAAGSRIRRGSSVTNGSAIEHMNKMTSMEQPFAVAGETALTSVEVVASDTDPVTRWYIRVQRLYGQQGTGMFGMIEVNSQLPARKPCFMASECGTGDDTITSSAKTKAVIPYAVYADPSTHNPAVMTKWGVVYAANPSYQMYSEFFRMCEEKAPVMQLSIDSSHGPTRLFRVNAFEYDDPGGVRAVSTGGVVEVPDGFDMANLGLDTCGKMYNVRATSMEYLNDQNIAVTVLRASPRSFNPTTSNFDRGVLEGADGQATLRYVVHFLNPVTMRLREGEMWEEDDSAATLGQGLLCPSQRRMPDLGSMAAEVSAAGLHAVRMFFELLFTGPAVFSPGSYKRIQTMNMNVNYGHSFLLNAGMGWLNFDPFFEALRRAHMHFWNSFTKIGSLFDDAPYVNQFLNGVAMYSQDYTPLVTRNMRRYLGAADRMAGAVDGKVTAMVETVAGKNPIVFTGLAASAGMLNMAQYALRMVRILLVQVLLPALDAASSGDGVEDVVNGLWQVVYDSQENYKTLILASEMRSCVGLQLMLGYTNPYARLAGAVCHSGIMFKLGAVNTAMAFFVDLPMLGCLCSGSDGLDYRQHAMDTCYTKAPSHFKGSVRALIEGSVDLEALCSASSLTVQARVRDSMDPFLAASYRASAILADVVDFTRYMWDASAGSCRDYAGDASVTAILPDPIEFWRICGGTKTCANKCAGSFKAFETAKQQYGVTIRDVQRVTARRTVKSAFFSDSDIVSSRAKAPFDILEMSEMADCMHTCGYDGMIAGDRCVAILGLQYGVNGADPMAATVVVAEYCVPQRMDAHVWLKRQWVVADSTDWAAGILSIRLLHQGRWHCRGYTGAFCSVAVLSDSAITLYREDGVPYVVEEYSPASAHNTRLTNVERIASLGNDVLLVQGAGFRDGVDSDKVPRSLCIDIRRSGENKWNFFAAIQCNQNVLDGVLQDIPVCIYDMLGACSSVLLVPTQDERAVVRCGWKIPAVNTEPVGLMYGVLQPRAQCEAFPLSRGAVKSAGLYNMIKVPLMGVFSTTVQQRRSAIVLSTAVSVRSLQLHAGQKEYSILVANHPKRHVNWLAALSVDTRLRGLDFHDGSPAAVQVVFKKGCRVSDCTGCQARAIQTLCYAAQQCTIANCIGTTVNLNKPLCAVGEVLADAMEHFLLQWRGSWNTMSLIIVQTIAVATTGKGGTEDTMDGLDELFTAQMCLQKDTIFDIAGTITSFLNANIDMVEGLVTDDGKVGALFSAPKVHDVENFVNSEYREAQRTMVLAAVTRFLGNIGLGAVYPMLVARKMMICQANDIVSVFDVAGFQLTITSPEYEDAYTGMVGKCMTEFESDNVQDEQSDGVNSALDGIVAWLGTVPFANYKHAVDGSLSYVQGLIRGVQDMVQVADTQHCKLTDASAYRQGQCACGDDPAKIPDAQVGRGIAESAFWCSGFLAMQTPFGMPIYVFNPYTYKELLAAAHGTDDFLECLSSESTGGCIGKEPVAPQHLRTQGAQLLPVIARCKANYQAMQWDAGAGQLFETTEALPPYLHELRSEIADARLAAAQDSTTARCMKLRQEERMPNDGCLLMYLASPAVGLRREDFFVYSMIGEDEGAGPGPFPFATQLIAACVVFSGPSKVERVGVEASKQFKKCTSPSSSVSDDGTACELAAYVWSSRSRNAVPVANLHAVGSNDPKQLAEDAAFEYERISEKVMAVLKDVRDKWTGNQMKVSLFTAEGDILHQALDCMFLGPYGRADLSPRDLGDLLPSLEYFRDRERGATRDFTLPCSGEELHGDTQAPYTCGSATRRSIIKNFVRHHAGANERDLKDLVAEQVLELFEETADVFNAWKSFGCTCPAGSDKENSAACCATTLSEAETEGESLSMYLRSATGAEKRALLESFVPAVLSGFEFSVIQNSGVADDILRNAYAYAETTVFKNVSTTVSYGVDRSAFVPSDAQRELAKSEGLFSTSGPLTTYGKDEALGEDATTLSAFEICVGAVSQVMFTLPVGDPLTGAPTTLPSLPRWDPMQTEPEGHFTALEAWVRALVSDARERSPLFWSHRVKHVASDSRVCVDRLATAGAPHAPKEWDPAQASAENKTAWYKALADDVQPGPTSGVYSSLLQSIGDGDQEGARLTFAPPEALKDDTALFQDTNSGTWALGKLAETCFCGWARVVETDGRVWCHIPLNVCASPRFALSERLQTICDAQSGLYWSHWSGSEDSRAVGVEMQEHMQLLDYLQCPWNAVDTAAWGLLDNSTFVDEWLLEHEGVAPRTRPQFTVKNLLYDGRGGLRFMNAESVIKHGRGDAYRFMNPLDVFATVAQQHCEKEVEAEAASEDAAGGQASYAEHFRDVLFPAVQGVPENRGLSFCLRYVVELATLTAMQPVLAATNLELVRQSEAVTVWKRKCHTQTKLLGFCALRGVFSAHKVPQAGLEAPDTAPENTPSNHESCVGVHFGGILRRDESFVVVGATCLVVYHRAAAANTEQAATVLIFDPCRAVSTCRFAGARHPVEPSPVSGNTTGGNATAALPPQYTTPPLDMPGDIEPTELNAQEFVAKYSDDPLVRLDAMSFVSSGSRTLSLKWSRPEDTHWDSLGDDVRARFAREHEHKEATSASAGLDIERLWQQYVRPPAGAPPSPGHWRTASGARGSDGAASCGGVSDWWPEAWEHPVGFHVTTPCKQESVAYRTFSNHFEYDADGHAMRYQHSALRDESLMMNNAGASGVCRLNTLGQTLREQNNIRVCTRMRRGVLVDYAVPVLHDPETEEWTGGQCSTSPHQVPWKTEGTDHPRLRSVGLLTSWPEPESTMWPGADSPLMDLGLHADDHADSWTEGGGDCGMPGHFSCFDDEDCQRHVVGVATDVVLKCLSSVCVVSQVTRSGTDDQTTAWPPAEGSMMQCSSHDDCSRATGLDQPDLLCSGEGRCVHPVIEVQNDFGADVDLSWHAKSCDAASMDSVDMYGKSPWGRITGLFEAHGLCSYRSWYEYRRVFEDHCGSAQQTGTDVDDQLCALGEDVQWIDTLREESVAPDIFASQDILYQEAHRCDRDFQHLQDTVLCRPRVGGNGGSLPSLHLNRRYAVPARYSSLYQTYYRRELPGDGGYGPHAVKIAQMEYMSNPHLGFLGVEEGDAASQGLVACVDIPQCSLPEYDIQGHVIPERRVLRHFATASTDYRVSDAVACGAFGAKSRHPSDDERCYIDFAVAPLALIVIEDNNVDVYCDVTNGFNVLRDQLTNVKRDGYKATHDGRDRVRKLLTGVLMDAFSTDFFSLATYRKRVQCASKLDERLQQAAFYRGEPSGGEHRNDFFQQVYEVTVDEEVLVDPDSGNNATETVGKPVTLLSSSVLNHFTTYSMVEVAPMWWYKCHLLSGVRVSAEKGVECEAWTAWRGAQAEAAAPSGRAVPSVTLKQYLQQTAVVLKDATSTKQAAHTQVVLNLTSALAAAHEKLGGGAILAPVCQTQKSFIQPGDAAHLEACINNEAVIREDFQLMMFQTYASELRTAVSEFSSACCTGEAGCTVSSHPREAHRAATDGVNHSIHTLVLAWLGSGSFGPLVQAVPDEVMLQARVPAWGNPEIALFSQPWLHMQGVGNIAASLARQLSSVFTDVGVNSCNVRAFAQPDFKTTLQDGSRTPCIFKGNPGADPMHANAPLKLDDEPMVKLTDSAGVMKWQRVCHPEGEPVQVAAGFLGQRCTIGFSSPTARDGDTSNNFLCQGSASGAKGCHRTGAKSQATLKPANPHPERVCYELGNECFNPNSGSQNKFSQDVDFRWTHAEIPPGVLVRTYGYQPNVNRLVGRSPRHLHSHEKIYWNNTHFNSLDVVDRVLLLQEASNLPKGATPKIYAQTLEISTIFRPGGPDGADDQTGDQDGDGAQTDDPETDDPDDDDESDTISVPGRRRRLLQQPTDNSSDAVASGPTHRHGRALLEAWWEHGGCGAGWMRKIDADRDTRYKYKPPDYQKTGYRESKDDDCAIEDEDGKCCQCNPENEFEMKDAYQVYSFGRHTVHGCVKCPSGQIRDPKRPAFWRDDEGSDPPCMGVPQDDEETSTPVTYDDVATCMINNPLWPPMLSWFESIAAESRGDSCAACDGKRCRYSTTLASYQSEDAEAYPAWFNCAQGTFEEFKAERVKQEDETYLGPRTMLQAMQNMPFTKGVAKKDAFLRDFSAHDHEFLDYDDSPTFVGNQVRGGNAVTGATVTLPATYSAVSLELLPGFSCSEAECDGLAVKLQDSYFYCSDCYRFPENRTFCSGQHDCLVHGIVATDYVQRQWHLSVREWQEREIMRLLNKQDTDSTLSVFETAHLLVHVMQSEYREAFLQEQHAGQKTIDSSGAFDLHTPLSELTTPSETGHVLAHPAGWNFAAFSPDRALNWEARTGEKKPTPENPLEFFLDIQACAADVGETNQVSYKQCSHNEQLIAMRHRVNKAYNSSGPLVVPARYFLQLPVAASQLVADDNAEDSGALLMWAEHAREPREKHFEYLMDFASLCRNTSIWDSVCRVSPVDEATIELLNPWTGGGYSVQAGCDTGMSRSALTTSEVYTTRCLNGQECHTQDTDTAFYRDQTPGCLERNGDAPEGARIVGPWMRSNVCFLKPTRAGGRAGAVCKHRQGLLGGGSGLPHENLYEYAVPPAFATRELGGLFVLPHRDVFRTTVFTAAGDVPLAKNFLNLNKFDIGGHHMHFVVSRDGDLHLYDLVLAGAAAGGAAARKLEVDALMASVGVDRISASTKNRAQILHRWLSWDPQAEHLSEAAHEPDLPEDDARPLHWACPLKQRLFLSGQAGAHFRPSLPNSRRAAVMFQQHSVDRRRSNSVQAMGMARDHVKVEGLRTSNGFCFCDSAKPCAQPIGGNGLCSLSQTVDSLSRADGRWHKSRVGNGLLASTCMEQVDWPYTGGQLRDGSFIGQGGWVDKNQAGPGAARESTCNLLDRMHDFEYQYVAAAAPEASAGTASAPRNTETPGGDCYTGRAQRAGGGGGGGSSSSSAAAATSYRWNPSERRSCVTQCERPPVFTAGSEHTEIPAETSFGVLFRERSDRAIAGNLREKLRAALCADASAEDAAGSSCEALDRMLNVSSWVRGAFWDAFVQDVTTLYTNTTYTHLRAVPLTQAEEKARQLVLATRTWNGSLSDPDSVIIDSTEGPPPIGTLPPPVPLMSARELLEGAMAGLDVSPEENQMWMVPWVYCERVSPVCVDTCNEETGLCTRECTSAGSSVGNCTGTIAREEWLDPSTRRAACAAALLDVQESKGITAVAPINVCDIDSSMDMLCRAIQAAKSEIFEQNCIASGTCFDEKFFYVPGLYSAANQEFVRATVEGFYLGAHEGSCPQTDAREEEVRESNEIRVQQCASTQLQVAHDLLRSMRTIVDQIMRIGYFHSMIWINLARYLLIDAATGDDHAWGQVQMYGELMLKEMGKLWTTLGDLVFSFVMDSGLGRAMQAFLDNTCIIIKALYDNIWLSFTCSLMRVIGETMRDLDILGWTPLRETGFTVLEYHRTDCVPRPNMCEDLSLPEEDPGPTALPIATRCWSTYSTFLGDARSLSCSAADTCMAGDLSALSDDVSEQSQVAGLDVCDSCPQAPSPSFSRYGCDLVTKTCKCGVQTILRTTCVANDECAFGGATCDIVDDLFARDAFGSQVCEECATSRICLVTPGDSVGHCACATTPVPYAPCEANSHGLTVDAPPFAMCMVTLGSNAQAEVAGSNQYEVESSKLATARCDMLDRASRFCTSVEMGPGFSQHYIVGLQNLFSRRLLSIGDANNTASSFFRFVIPPDAYELALHADWSAVHTSACRHVPRLVEAERPGAPALPLADTELLRSCVRWRAIGLEIVHLTNISDVVPETFLVGPEDFAYDVVAHPHRIYAVLRRPWVAVRAIMHTQWMAPVRVVVRDVHRWWVHSQIAAFAAANEWVADAAAAKAAADGGGNVSNSSSSSSNRSNSSSSSSSKGSPTTVAESLRELSQGMSLHLARQLWSNMFTSASAPPAYVHPAEDRARETLRGNARRRHMRAHTAAIGHSVLHTPLVRAHWVPEDEADDKDGEGAAPGERGSGAEPLAPPPPRQRTRVGSGSSGGRRGRASTAGVLPTLSAHLAQQSERKQQQQQRAAATATGAAARRHSRSLKEAVEYSFIERLNAVQQYSSEVALGEGVVQILPKAAAEEYARGEVLWPPTFVYWDTEDTCALATNTIDAVKKTVRMLERSYNADDVLAGRPPVSYNPFQIFQDAWTRGETTGRSVLGAVAGDDEDERTSPPKQTFAEFIETSAPWYIQTPVQWVYTTTGLTEVPLLGLLYELPAVLARMLRCDIEAQMFCSSHHYSVFTSAFIAILILTLVGSVVSFSGVPVVATLLSVVGFGSLVLFISFDYAPACAPILPVCFFESIVNDLVYWLPTRITIPQSLLLCQVDQTTDNVAPECLVDCSAAPFHFQDYTSNVAWLMCQASLSNCHSLQLYLGRAENPVALIAGKATVDRLAAALYRSRTVLASGDHNMREGFQWCNMLSIYQLVPMLVMLFLVASAVPVLLALLIKALVGLMRAAFSAYAMTHL